jgi:hypothetical protein
MSGRLKLAPSNATFPSLNIPQGADPTTPVVGDVWGTSSGLYANVNGTVYRLAPLRTSDVTAWALTLPTTLPATAGLLWNNGGTLAISQ